MDGFCVLYRDKSLFAFGAFKILGFATSTVCHFFFNSLARFHSIPSDAWKSTVVFTFFLLFERRFVFLQQHHDLSLLRLTNFNRFIIAFLFFIWLLLKNCF
jgi:hypothetical protein